MLGIPVSDITIGSFRFSGVHDVRIRRSIHSYVETATITIPATCVIRKKGKATGKVQTTATQFVVGDKVSIKLALTEEGNVTDAREEFRGFVKQVDMSAPLTITCEGYAWQLRRNSVSCSFKKPTVKQLLQEAVKGTNITVRTDIDTPLTPVIYSNDTGAKIIDNILSWTEGTLSICFIEPDVLYCGLVYMPWSQGKDEFGLPQVQYRIDFNTPKDNGLKVKEPGETPTQVIYGKKQPNGEKLFSVSQARAAKKKLQKLLNNVASKEWLQKLADEKERRINYAGYEGTINAFLTPYCLPGYKAFVKDGRYPKRDGIYLVESTEVRYGVEGAWRSVEVGPRISFANDAEWNKQIGG